MVERRIRAARFPAVKSFDTFDFAAIPSLNKPLALELARLANMPSPARTSSLWAIADLIHTSHLAMSLEYKGSLIRIFR